VPLGSGPIKVKELLDSKEETPDTNPEKYTPVRGRPAKINSETGEVWEVDKSGHYGGRHYECL